MSMGIAMDEEAMCHVANNPESNVSTVARSSDNSCARNTQHCERAGISEQEAHSRADIGTHGAVATSVSSGIVGSSTESFSDPYDQMMFGRHSPGGSSITSFGSTRSTDPLRPPSPDFSHLSDDERRCILRVLRRQQDEERQNVRYIRGRLRDLALTMSMQVGPHGNQVCNDCTQKVLRECTKWTSNPSSLAHTGHNCELRQHHMAMSGTWYTGAPVTAASSANAGCSNADAATSRDTGRGSPADDNLSSYLLLKATTYTTGDRYLASNTTNTSLPPAPHSTSNSLYADDPKQTLPDNSTAGDSAHHSGEGEPTLPLGDRTPGEPLPTSQSTHLTAPSPELATYGLNSPRCSFDSGISSLDSSQTSSILKKTIANMPPIHASPQPPQRRVSFSLALEQVQTFSPTDSVDLNMIEVVDAIGMHDTNQSVLDSPLASSTSSQPSPQDDDNSIADLLPASMAGGLAQTLSTAGRASTTDSPHGFDSKSTIITTASHAQDHHDNNHRQCVGQLCINVMHSCLLDNQVSYHVQVVKGKSFVVDPDSRSNSPTTETTTSSSSSLSSSSSGKKAHPLRTLSRASSCDSIATVSTTTTAQSHFIVQCHMVCHGSSSGNSKLHKGKPLRTMTTKQVAQTPISHDPVFNEQLAIIMKQTDVTDKATLTISILERRHVGLLRRQVTREFGTAEVMMSSSTRQEGKVTRYVVDVLQNSITTNSTSGTGTSSRGRSSSPSTTSSRSQKTRLLGAKPFKKSPHLAPSASSAPAPPASQSPLTLPHHNHGAETHSLTTRRMSLPAYNGHQQMQDKRRSASFSVGVANPMAAQ
eukprot:scpid30862/ scgid7608/ 